MKKKWTLRRIQIAAIIVITVLFLARVFIPPMTQQARAEKLYLDGWFLTVRVKGGGDRETDKNKSVEMFKQALALSPGNSLYEQALVWKCPEKDLHDLIVNGKLGKKAFILANHRYYTYLDKQADNDERRISSKKPKKPSIYSASDMYYYPPLHQPEYWRKKLERLEKLAAVDPDNALIRYRRAYIFANMGRQSDMLNEVRKANAMDLCAIRVPEISPRIVNTLADPRNEGIFGDLSQLRELARQMAGYSNEQLRNKNVTAALAASEDACRMGVKLASMEPVNFINYLVATAVFAIGRAKVDAIYRNFGMTDEMKKYQSVGMVFENGVGEFRKYIENSTIISQPYPSITTYAFFAIFSIFSLILFILLWGVTSLIRRIMHRQKVDIKAWDEGWLLKIMLTLYLPLLLITLIVNSFIKQELSSNIFRYIEGPDSVAFIIIAIQLSLMIVLMLKLKKQYSISHGEKVSLLKFQFRIPMEARAWICRSFTLMFAAQTIFLLVCGMLASQFFISYYKTCPWQFERLPVIYNNENAVAQKQADRIRKIAIEKSIIKSDNNSIGHVSGR